MGQSRDQLAKLLDGAYQAFHSEFYRKLDPVHVVHEYSRREDQEIVAFVSALLSYGNVTSIVKSIRRALAPLGPHPYQFVCKNELSGLWAGFYHRFTQGQDIEILFRWIQSALRSHQSLEDFFLLEKGALSMKDTLSAFVKRFTQQPLPNKLLAVSRVRQRNLKYLISDPERGSACKRLNLFLRWVVRPKDRVDLGLWRGLHPSSLILPLDTHLLKTLHLLGWSKSTSATWDVAEAATEKLKLFCPEDPLKYDFALCHLSMHGFSLLESKKVWGANAKVE